jgi:hypothetical protein
MLEPLKEEAKKRQIACLKQVTESPFPHWWGNGVTELAKPSIKPRSWSA